MGKAIALAEKVTKSERNAPVIGVFRAGDPRIDAESRQRCQNIIRMAADRTGHTHGYRASPHYERPQSPDSGDLRPRRMGLSRWEGYSRGCG